MKKNIMLLCMLLGIASMIIPLHAHSYNAAIGGRLEAGKDGNHGVTYKYFLAEHCALEGMALSDFSNGLEFHLFYVYQQVLPAAPSNLQWYAGVGGHVGFWGKDDEVVAGPDGLIGLEYIFTEIPLVLALDWHPVFNIISENDDKFWPMKFGLTARYCF